MFEEHFAPGSVAAKYGMFNAIDPDEEGVGPGDGLSQMPCGRCPVADDCRIGGVVNPDDCVYLKEWLGSGDIF